MNNKIKIIASFILGLFCFVSCAFDGNLGFYEIKINDWAEVTYWLQDKNDTSSIKGFRLYATQKNLEVDERYELYDSDRGNEVLQMPNRIIYNNNIIVSDDGYLNSEYCKYYIITPVGDGGGGKRLPFTKEQITREQYDSIEANCKDCKILDTAKLQKIHDEEQEKERNSFPTKTVKIFFIILLYIIYRVYKSRRRKKPQKKV